MSAHFKAAIIFIFVSSTVSFARDEFYCFDESERKKLTYSNAPNKSIENLQTIRFIQGFWGSQWAMQYAAFIYLKEKMGVSVSWYPEMNETDPEILFYYDYEDRDKYPIFYWSWIDRNNYDMLVEMWPVAAYMANQYYANDTVLYVGTPGDAVYGEMGWFVPQYMADENLLATSPYHLDSNETLKQMLIESYTNLSDIDWVQYYNENVWDEDDEWNIYDKATYDKPIIWGSSPLYFTSIYSHKLTQNMFDGKGIDFTFIPVGTEKKLSQFIDDLYSKQLPFIVNNYSPSIDFALNSGFERVSNPRNPSNAVRDECYEKAECAQPIQLLFKLANPRLSTQFPEILKYVESFQMISTDVNHILQTQHTLLTNNATLTLDETWMMAACEWLKAYTHVTDTWHVDIVRYDCPDGISTNECNIIVMNDGTTSIILLSLGGIVGLIILIIVIYKMIAFCKEFQRKYGAFEGDANDLHSQKLKKQKRRLLTSIFSDCYAFILSTVDVATDIFSSVIIIDTYKEDNKRYSKTFVICYFALTVLISFVSAIHIFIIWKNIFVAYNEFRRGVLYKEGGVAMNLIKRHLHAPMTATAERTEIIAKGFREIQELEFRKHVLTRKIQGDSVTIAVAFCEDLPFLGLNLFAIVSNSNNTCAAINGYLMASLLINCLSFGYKMCIAKAFFGNLFERNSLNQLIATKKFIKSQRILIAQKTQLLLTPDIDDTDDCYDGIEMKTERYMPKDIDSMPELKEMEEMDIDSMEKPEPLRIAFSFRKSSRSDSSSLSKQRDTDTDNQQIGTDNQQNEQIGTQLDGILNVVLSYGGGDSADSEMP